MTTIDQELWDEVRQGESDYSQDRVETPLKFPKGVRLRGKSYNELKVLTTLVSSKDNLSEFSSEIYDGSSERLACRKRKGNEMFEVHRDLLNGIRGNYVREHINDSN